MSPARSRSYTSPTSTKAVSFKGRVDRWQEFEYVAPSCILQFTGALDVGLGAYEQRKRDGGFGLRIFYGITPETEHTCWFFWSAANGYRQNEPEATDALFTAMDIAFREDDAVLEHQYATLRKLGDRSLVNINSDGARIHARLALERKIAAERGIPEDEKPFAERPLWMPNTIVAWHAKLPSQLRPLIATVREIAGQLYGSQFVAVNE